MRILGGAVLAVAVLLRPWLFAVCHDEEYARVAGLPVRALNLVLAVTTAVTVTVAMRAVGLLLVSALMVVPVATAQQLTRGFRATMLVAVLLGLIVSGGGIWSRPSRDTGPGATVVLLAIAGFFAVDRRRLHVARGRAAAPARRPTRAGPDDTRGGARPCGPWLLTTVTVAHMSRTERLRSGRRAVACARRPAAHPHRDRARRRPALRPRAGRHLGAPQPLVSQHLRVLRGAGVVRGSRRGREIAYALTDEHIAHIVADAVIPRPRAPQPLAGRTSTASATGPDPADHGRPQCGHSHRSRHGWSS